MAVKLEMLRCFVAVAQSGKLSDAAHKLGRSPSAISMMLRQFEDHLGAALFETDRKNKLTALGQFTLNAAHRELDHFERTISEITSFAKAKSGLVRIASVPSVAGVILPRVMQKFVKTYPKVTVDMRDMDSIGVQRELEKDRIDIGIATGVSTGADIKQEFLFSDEFGIVCPKGHPLISLETPLAWQDLKGVSFITNGLCSQIKDETFQGILSRSSLMVRNTTSLLALVREGVGVTVVPRLVVKNTDHDLAFIRVNDTTARRNIQILKHVDTRFSPAVQNFERIVRSVSQDMIFDT